MDVRIYYRKGDYTQLFELDQVRAGRFTPVDLMKDWALVSELTLPEETTAEKVYQLFQGRALKPVAGVEHANMTVGDMIIMDHELCICCRCGWFRLNPRSINDEGARLLCNNGGIATPTSNDEPKRIYG
jgi:hypothetical protein